MQTQIQNTNSDQESTASIYEERERERERERVDLFEILGSDAGEIETEAAMEEKEKDCGDRGERRSKRHGVSFSEREIMDLWVTVRKRAKREVFVVNLFCFFYMRSLSLHDKLEMRSLRGLWGFEIHFSPVMITTVTPAHKYHILAHHSQNSPTPVYRQNILCKNTHYVKIHM